MSHTVVCGHPDAAYFGASPDAKVPTGVPTVSEAGHIKIVNEQATLKKSHKYYWQVQGQLVITEYLDL